MASGMRTMVENTQERAVSTDINRLQAFKAQDVGELFFQMFDPYGSDDFDAAAVLTTPSTLEAPLRAEVFNGLLVKPSAASLSLLVDAGVLYAVAPDSDPDASVYKYVRDAGVSVLGTLVMTTNPAGSARIDVVECRINPTPSTVSDSRDIFNATTGAFVPTSVTKETKYVLEYRVRAGTAGAGYPAAQSGWLPLAVALVPAGATTVDTMTFWDVRPLLNDREYQPSALYRSVPKTLRSMCWWNPMSGNSVATNLKLRGIHEIGFKGRRYGGKLRRGSPGTDDDTVDLLLAANQEAAYTAVGGTNSNIYLCAPYGLPRWARYTDGPTNRVPRSPRGILLLSTVQPSESGVAGGAITPPTTMGLVTAFAAADCVHVGTVAYGNIAGAGDQYSGFHRTDDRHTFVASLGRGTNSASNNLLIEGSAVSAQFSTYTLTRDKHFPRNAKSILATIEIDDGITWASSYGRIYVMEPGSATEVWTLMEVELSVSPIALGRASMQVEIPLPFPYPGGGTWGTTQTIQVYYGGASGTPALSFFLIEGWKLH